MLCRCGDTDIAKAEIQDIWYMQQHERFLVSLDRSHFVFRRKAIAFLVTAKQLTLCCERSWICAKTLTPCSAQCSAFQISARALCLPHGTTAPAIVSWSNVVQRRDFIGVPRNQVKIDRTLRVTRGCTKCSMTGLGLIKGCRYRNTDFSIVLKWSLYTSSGCGTI